MLTKALNRQLFIGFFFTVCGIVNAEEEKTPEATVPASSQQTVSDSGATNLPRRAGPERPKVNIRGTETFIAEYVGDNGGLNESLYGDDDNFWSFRNLFYFQASNRDFSSGMRLDAALFHNPPHYVEPSLFQPGGEGYTTLNYSNDFRVERLHGTVHLGHLHATVGDFYVNFGRGMALSLIKVDDVGVDNTLRGIRLEYRIPRKLKAVVVGGLVNSLNIDSITHQLQEDDPMDRIVGARIEWEIMDALNLGVHGVYMHPRFTDESQIPDHRQYVDQGTGVGVATGGASLELHLGGLHVYLEGNGQSHDNYRPIGNDKDILNESGFAAFGEVSYDLSPFNLKGEAIFYRRWLMEGPFRGSANNIGATQPLAYHHMVTLEPLWMVIKSFGNAAGGRLTGDLYLKESDTQFTLATALIYYMGGLMPQGEWEDHPATLVVHPTLKIRQEFSNTGIYSSLEGGFRQESTKEPESPGEDTGFLWHLKGDVSIPLTGPHSIELKGELRRHSLTITEGADGEYWVTLASLAYDWSGLLGITVVHEYSNQTDGASAKIGAWDLPLPDHQYLWLMATFHLPAPLDDLNLRFIGGSQRGGIKCAGGVCRRFPDAVGARLEAVYRFLVEKKGRKAKRMLIKANRLNLGAIILCYLIVGNLTGCGQEDLVFPDSGLRDNTAECGVAYPQLENAEQDNGPCYCVEENNTFPCLVWESARQNGEDTYISASNIYLDAKHGLTNTRSIIIIVSAENCSTCTILISAIKNRAADFEAAGAFMVGTARRSLTGSTEDPDFDLDKAERVLASESWPLEWPITNDKEGYLSRTFDTATPWVIVVDAKDMKVKVASNQRFTPDPSGVEELLQFIDEF